MLDAFRDAVNAGMRGISVDGLAITRGRPRQHVFTFAHGCTEVFGDGAACCCHCDEGTAPPAFVGASYLCGEPQQSVQPGNTGNRFFDEGDPLFDGAGIEDAACIGAPESRRQRQRKRRRHPSAALGPLTQQALAPPAR